MVVIGNIIYHDFRYRSVRRNEQMFNEAVLKEKEEAKLEAINEKVLKVIEKEKGNAYNYNCDDAEEKAEQILKAADFFGINTATPIVKLTKYFGFGIFQTELPPGQSGEVRVLYEDTKERYGTERVILVNEEDELYHQRFVIAHELAHYLFEYYGQKEYREKKPFYNQYRRNEHGSVQEKLANRFAASILMPREQFLKQYNIAMLEGNDNYMFVVKYLSLFFETTPDSIERRIREVV